MTHTHTYICNGILLSHKKDETSPFVMTWMDLEGIVLSEISQMEKEKYHMISLMWNTKKSNKQMKNKINEQTKDEWERKTPQDLESRGDLGSLFCLFIRERTTP